MKGKKIIQGSLVRAVYGVVSLLFPKVLFTATGLKDADPDTRYINRILGGRELLLASSSALSVRDGSTNGALAANLVAAASDTVALVEEIRERGKVERALVVGIGFNVLSYVLWFRSALARPATPKEKVEQLSSQAADAIGDQVQQVGKRFGKKKKRASKQAAKQAAKVEAKANKRFGKASKQAQELQSQAGKRAQDIQSQAGKRAQDIQSQASKRAQDLQKQAVKQAQAAKDAVVAGETIAADRAVKASRRAAKKARAAAEAAQAA
jgi:hypothetical protein